MWWKEPAHVTARYYDPLRAGERSSPLRRRTVMVRNRRKESKICTLRTVEDAGPYDSGRLRYAIERYKK